MRLLYFGSGDMEVRIRDDEAAGTKNEWGERCLLRIEPATKTGTLCEIQALDQSEISASEMDKLEMLAALEEPPAKASAVEVSAEAGRLPAANQSSVGQSSDVHSSDVQSSGAADARAFDLTSEATQASSIPTD